MIKFLVFSDLHYKKKMYASSVKDLNTILDRAAKEKVDFVVHGGDFSNDYLGSPEIIKAYLNNKYSLPVYGVFGNHELESENNSVEVVKPFLSNQPIRFAVENAAYWSYDIGEYLLIGLDSNFSYSDALQAWEHNRTASWGAPDGNRLSDSLSPEQLVWLDETIAAAAQAGKKVIVIAHAGFSGVWESSPDAKAVRDIYAKYPGTVKLSINGHYHTDHFGVVDGVAYFDVNTVQNGFWALCEGLHYAPEHTFTYTDYDAEGNELGSQEMKLNDLVQASNTWFFTHPTSAVVTIEDDGTLTVDGIETQWYYGVLPEALRDGKIPGITSQKVKI